MCRYGRHTRVFGNCVGEAGWPGARRALASKYRELVYKAGGAVSRRWVIDLRPIGARPCVDERHEYASAGPRAVDRVHPFFDGDEYATVEPSVPRIFSPRQQVAGDARVAPEHRNAESVVRVPLGPYVGGGGIVAADKRVVDKVRLGQ